MDRRSEAWSPETRIQVGRSPFPKGSIEKAYDRGGNNA
jgi:hypothetical protein